MEETKKPVSKRRLPDGSYNKKPLDPNYFNIYYHSKGKEIIKCNRCGKECRKNYLSKHTNTTKCWAEFCNSMKVIYQEMPEFDF